MQITRSSQITIKDRLYLLIGGRGLCSVQAVTLYLPPGGNLLTPVYDAGDPV